MLCLILGITMSCSDSVTDQLLDNEPPTVTVFLQSDGTLNRTSSNQILHWDGKDSDGLVVGFWYSFGNSSADRGSWIFLSDSATGEKELENIKIPPIPPSWKFTTARSDTFVLSILSDTVTFTFSIIAEISQLSYFRVRGWPRKHGGLQRLFFSYVMDQRAAFFLRTQ